MATPQPVHRLDLRLRELAQLFNSLDPAPFLDRDEYHRNLLIDEV